jgi:hypothetical protein
MRWPTKFARPAKIYPLQSPRSAGGRKCPDHPHEPAPGITPDRLIAELGINTIAHHHDFYWERRVIRVMPAQHVDTAFPAKLLTINT